MAASNRSTNASPSTGTTPLPLRFDKGLNFICHSPDASNGFSLFCYYDKNTVVVISKVLSFTSFRHVLACFCVTPLYYSFYFVLLLGSVKDMVERLSTDKSVLQHQVNSIFFIMALLVLFIVS